MKKSIALAVLLLLGFMIVGCGANQPFEVGSNENIENKLNRVMDEFEQVLDYYISGQANDEFEMMIDEDETYYPEDYLTIYNSQDATRSDDFPMYPVYELYLYFSVIFNYINYDIPRNDTTFSVSLPSSVVGPSIIDVYLKDFDTDYVRVEISSEFSNTIALVLGFDISGKLEMFSKVLPLNPESDYIRNIHFKQGESFTFIEKFDDDSAIIMKADLANREFYQMNYSVSVNEDLTIETETNYTYYENWNQIRFSTDGTFKDLELRNMHGRYFSYIENQDSVEIEWQLLESTGWDYVHYEGIFSSSTIGNGVFVGETNIYNFETDQLYNVIRTSDGFATLFLSKTMPIDDVTDSIINLSEYGLTFNFTDLTKESIQLIMDQQASLIETRKDLWTVDGLIEEFNQDTIYFFLDYMN